MVDAISEEVVNNPVRYCTYGTLRDDLLPGASLFFGRDDRIGQVTREEGITEVGAYDTELTKD